MGAVKTTKKPKSKAGKEKLALKAKNLKDSKMIDGYVNELKPTAVILNENKGLFIVKSADKWLEEARKRPIPKMLFSELWFEGEICFLFADTNLGKSIMAVQIGESISSGKAIPSFKLQADKQPILYFDFELSDKQFENRYSNNFEDHYSFNEEFTRIEINPDSTIPNKKSFEEYLHESLEKTIVETKAKVLIIDNLTFLSSETEQAKNALPLMKKLKELKNKYELSILVLAHTPKRDLSKPITRNDLAGSKMLINFCDSAFTIGESQLDKSIRYIKQIKARNTEVIYDAKNVCVCKIQKLSNFLEFKQTTYDEERNHLEDYANKGNEEMVARAKQLIKEGMSQRDAAKELGIAVGTVNKYVNK